ncbi:MAG: TonB-dependent receptor [Gammaproteobacteria bacterium]
MRKSGALVFLPCRLILLAGLFALVTGGYARDNAGASPARPVLEQVHVIGQQDNIYTIPGSAHYIDDQDIRALSYDDINRVLRQVPGVYLREEDGFGLFPNISLRGVDTSRSAKVTLMEDGILAAPAPYAAPSAYYSPTTGRMSGLEVLKGTSQTRYGPHTTGGVINYLSTPIPEDQRVFLRAQYGEDNEIRAHGVVGNTIDTDMGRVGYLVEGYFRETDGFKHIDTTPDFNNSGKTGFYNIEPMIKLAWEPDSDVYQRLEFKYGFTDKDADETYLGLSTADFRADPYRRYSASRFDNISTEHHRTSLRHFISPTPDFDVVTTVYYNKFRRNWYKLADIEDVGGIAGNNFNLSSALAGAGGGTGLACLRGTLDCNLDVRANRRQYYSWGIQSDATWRLSTGNVAHELTAGIRYHEDEEARFQEEDTFVQAANGTIINTIQGIPGSNANRADRADAVAFFIQDKIEFGNWWLTPGFRYETIDYERANFAAGTVTPESLDVMGGSIAGGYDVTDEWQVFGGVNFGFSPPSPGGAISGLEEETSIGYELGTRYAGRDGALIAEGVGFYTSFEDLIVVSNIGGTGTGIDENIGEVDAYGVELSGTFDLARANNWSFSNQYYLAFTYTKTEQKNEARSTDAESIFSFGAKGNEVPYIPEYQLTVGASLDFANWGGELSATFVDDTFTSASNVTTELNGNGDPDARFGKTDAYEIVDMSVYARPRENLKLFAGVHNVFDTRYIVSRQPHGPRPGMPRSWFTGVEVEF